MPSLVVLLVVDQMRADYVDRFAPDWSRGLHRIISEGAHFTNAAYPYLGTYTCAGHSTIGTGTFPYRHGNFQNTWYDRETKTLTACADDALAEVMSYSGQARRGVGTGAGRLLVPTFADRLREERRARVVSLSLKARSAIMLAGHGGHAVTWLGDAPEGWQTSTTFSTSPVAAVRAFIDAHPIDADFRKVWDRALPRLRYRDPDSGEGEAPLAGWSDTFPHALVGTSHQPDSSFRSQWEASPFADAYLGALAAHLVKTERLGRRDTTDVLAIAFSSPDLVGHRFGPRSQEVQDVYAHLDRTIGTLLDRIDQLVGRHRYVVALSADHGVADIPEQAKRRGQDAGKIAPLALTQAIEGAAQASLGRGRYVAGVNTNDVYFEPGIYARLQADKAALDQVVKAMTTQPGIERVFRSEEIAGATRDADPLRRAAALSYVPGRSGDLVVALKRGWMFSSSTATTHGTANSYDQRVPLIFMGAGIRPGRYTDPVTPADIAPTLAALFGLQMSHAEGRVLSAALSMKVAGATTSSSR